MPPVSSLVFVVILAVWAVYLVQHWVRRRDHLATARSVDRFSEAMRVLERRRALPVPEATAEPRSYAASPLRPARPGRPEVVVKRAVPRVHGATAVAPSRDQRRSRRLAQLRAAALLAGSLAMVVLVALATGGVLPRWSALLGVGTCALAFALVRWSVAQQRSAGRSAAGRRPAARPAPAGRDVMTDRRVAPVHHPAAGHRRHTHDGHEFSAQSVAATLRTMPRREAGRVAVADRSGPELYDIHAVEASHTPPTVQTLSPADPGHELPGAVVEEQPAAARRAAPADGTWDPVPVPPPTYTLKAKAYRPLPTGSATMPADGTEMALDEEFEDLPRIDRVG